MALLDLPDDYDLDHLEGALEYLTSFRTAIDIGAHRGIWTRAMQKRFDRVVSFEPVRELFAQIPGTDKYNVALGNKTMFCGIDPGEKNSGQGHVVAGDDVRIYRLDMFGIAEVDFIKIDVEGYELRVLEGAIVTLQQKPAILLENNGLFARYGIEDDEIERFLGAFGYKFRDKWRCDELYTT
ncbi:MAG: FkbM family methyltransferase [Gammaproteobacteria bacterium]